MLWAVSTLCSLTFAQSDVDKGCENLARDIGLLLSAGISDYSPKLESVFRRRTDESWRPDRVQNRVNLPQSSYEVSEIVDYRTSISDLLEDSSEKIRKLLSGADQGVSELQETLLDLYKKKVRVTYNETEVKTLDKKYYFNAGYTNTEVENLEEDDPYSSIRQRIESLRLNKCFGQGQINVSFEQSTVHVPFNVYSLSDDVLTTASYSTGLDKTFENNAKNSKVLSWQYFASSKGLSRFYPGLKWKLEDEIKRPIDYDARFESWYASSINYPKEIIIMVDSSGSMKGYRKVLAILTIRTIIDSLSDQDFFNVIHFESTPSYLHGCFERTLVRATDFNKQQLKVLLQSMKASNVADFNKAINETYKVFKEFSESQFSLTQNYYPAARGIMMLSDGALEDYAEAFNNASIALNDSNINFEDIRVFTYLIGKDLKHQMPLKNIACARRGYYTHIASPADVKNNVMEYFHTMNRPLVNQDVYGVKPQWSPMYSSSLIGGLKVHGLVVSATQAVYAKDTVTNSGELLGVVGTDVPLVFLEQYLPKPYILGPHGYAFITNANGQLLSHPDLQIREENGSMKTTYRSMTLITMELYRETPSRKKDIMDAIRLAANGTSKVYKRGFEARRIIDCGSAKISCRKLAVDTENVLTDYSFIGLNENFVLGIAQPRLMKNGNLQFAQNTEKLLLPKNKMIRGSVNLIQECSKPLGNPGQQSNRKQLICEFYNGVNSNTLKLAGNWEFCKFQYYLYTDGQRCAPIEQTQALLDYVSSNRKGSTNVNYNCDDSMIDSLLYDIHMTAILPGMWADYLRPTGVTAVIDFAYVLTRTGLLRFYDNSRTGNVVSIDLLEPYDIGFEKFSYSRLFRIAASYKKGTTVYLLNPKDSQKYLTARTWSLGESVNFKPSKFSSEYHVAMLTEGYQIRRDYLVDLIRQEAGDLQCKNINAGNTTQAACNNNIKDCYLLDDYGTIFVSANKSETGLTLAAADSKLMQAMKTDKIFIGKGAKDYQATCSEVQTVNDQDEDGINLKTEFPINTKEDLKNPSKPSQDDDITNEYNKARPCLKEFTIYHINKAFTEDLGKKRAAFCKQEIERGQDECSTRSYSLRKIKNTNLSLLVADSCCTLTGAGSCPASENILTPEKFLSELTPKEKSLTKDALCANLKEDNIRRVLLDKLESTDNITQSPCSSSAIKIVFSNSLFFRMILFYLLNLMFT